MTDLITFTNRTAVTNYTTLQPDRTVVIYKEGVYDVTEFLDDHPGGPELITDHKNGDISDIFVSEHHHEHSANAQRMLAKYRIGTLTNDGQSEGDHVDAGDAYPKVSKDKIEYNGFTIDRNRGLVPQVLGLNKKQYMHMIHNSLHLPHCRLFDTDLFEGFSRNPWWRIPMVWIPVCIYLMYYGLTFDYPEHSAMDKYLITSNSTFSIFAVIASLLCGGFIWSLAEYGLHRGVFHFDDPLPDNKYALYLHFIIHGIHHMIPMDPDRLVFPPTLGGIVYSILFPTITWIFPGNFGRMIGVGFIIGYMCYDMTHIYIHHCQPFIGHLKEMKKYHNKHHYVDGNKGFGITSKVWDKVFGTELA